MSLSTKTLRCASRLTEESDRLLVAQRGIAGLQRDRPPRFSLQYASRPVAMSGEHGSTGTLCRFRRLFPAVSV